MVGRRPLGPQGFTLLEALVAMVLSSVVVMLVTSVFMAQNRFYSETVKRAALHESVRTAAALVSSEMRGLTAGGIVAAEPDSLMIRAPLVMGVVCGVDERKSYIFLPLGGEAFGADEVSGYALRAADGSWSYRDGGWASFHHSSGSGPAGVCAEAGSDVRGAVADFHRLDDLAASGSLRPGDLVMLYQERVLKLATSVLDPSTMGIYRGPSGSTLSEAVTGLTGESGFRYELPSQPGFQDRVLGTGNLQSIQRIQFTAAGASPSGRPGGGSSTFRLTATVPPKNVR